MEFKVPKIDLRSGRSGETTVEDENGNVIGQFRFHSSGTHPDADRTIILFGKYFGQYRSHKESQAFADGVAAVLTHITKVEHAK
jgi:hypothetical protein